VRFNLRDCNAVEEDVLLVVSLFGSVKFTGFPEVRIASLFCVNE
jgi:hypothetical protein